METKSFVMTSSFYPPYHVGGACIHVYHLANALAELGHEVHIVYSLDCYRLKKGNVRPKEIYPNNENIVLHPIKSPLSVITPIVAHTFGEYYPLSNKILQIIKDANADVIHHHNISGFGPFILKAKADRVIYTAHDYWLICSTYARLKYNKTQCLFPQNCSICSILSRKPPQIWRYIYNKRIQIENIDTIISPSNFMRNELTRLGISKKIKVIPNFVEIDKSEKKRYFKYPYLLYVGRLEYGKGIIELMESFLEISKNIDYCLVIVGDGDIKEKIIAQSEKSQGKIHYLGQLSVKSNILSNLYQNAEAVVIPSIYNENCPLVALEAISYGTPIIASNTSGFPEIIETTKGGFLIDSKNTEELKKNLLKILVNKNLLNKIKSNIKSATNYYSKDNYIKNYLSLLKNSEM